MKAEKEKKVAIVNVTQKQEERRRGRDGEAKMTFRSAPFASNRFSWLL
jgi:hypothetical protein